MEGRGRMEEIKKGTAQELLCASIDDSETTIHGTREVATVIPHADTLKLCIAFAAVEALQSIAASLIMKEKK